MTRRCSPRTSSRARCPSRATPRTPSRSRATSGASPPPSRRAHAAALHNFIGPSTSPLTRYLAAGLPTCSASTRAYSSSRDDGLEGSFGTATGPGTVNSAGAACCCSPAIRRAGRMASRSRTAVQVVGRAVRRSGGGLLAGQCGHGVLPGRRHHPAGRGIRVSRRYRRGGVRRVRARRRLGRSRAATSAGLSSDARRADTVPGGEGRPGCAGGSRLRRRPPRGRTGRGSSRRPRVAAAPPDPSGRGPRADPATGDRSSRETSPPSAEWSGGSPAGWRPAPAIPATSGGEFGLTGTSPSTCSPSRSPLYESGSGWRRRPAQNPGDRVALWSATTRHRRGRLVRNLPCSTTPGAPAPRRLAPTGIRRPASGAAPAGNTMACDGRGRLSRW